MFVSVERVLISVIIIIPRKNTDFDTASEDILSIEDAFVEVRELKKGVSV